MGVIFETGLLSVYLSVLLAFSFVTHPVNYCLLLLLGALLVSIYSYLLLGFSWYLVLFCLVYVGGVYVLFIFVSLHQPNPIYYFGGSYPLIFIVWSIFWVILLGFNNGVFSGYYESSHYLCSFFEGFSYCFFCLILMVGFVIISVVSSTKGSFSR